MSMNRRNILTLGAGAGLALSFPTVARSNTPSAGAQMRERATAFLTALDEAQRGEAMFGFDGRQRKAWNFMLGSRFAPGLALEQMNSEQKDLALELLATGASKLGLEKSMNIMLQQDILRDEWGKGSPDRNRERFSIQIYGKPSEKGAWSWRWEGHHLSLTFTMLDDEVISTTPSSFSSEPNTVPSGPHKGLVVLKEEEALARNLFNDLDGKAKAEALVWERSPGNIRSNRGAEGRVAGEKEGIALADLKTGQAQMVERLIDVYTSEPLPPTLADRQTFRLNSEDTAAIRFAWGGADLDGSIYYRITGENLLIEFATLVNQPQHLHAVFHDVKRNFGGRAV